MQERSAAYPRTFDEIAACVAARRDIGWHAEQFLVDAVRQLRDAWNAHMATCPQHAALPDLPGATWADLEAWRNAPSGTASA